MSSTATPFGKYELLDRIAAGGMAEIFRARYSPAPGIVKQVVIKKILPHYAENKAFIAMFTNEARIAMGLSHGSIAQVFDFGCIDGDYFIAMEFVDGQPLSKVVKRAKAVGIATLPPELAVSIAIELLKGLHYAHTRLDEQGRPLQIVHRDVSPQNVLVSYEGQIKVVDFGIARARNATSREDSASNAVKGKYAYFAPEQAKARELDARTDVFASGIVLYEMLCGQLPFQGRMMDALSRIVRGQFPRPRELNPGISVALEQIILKAMALEKADRYQTAQSFQEALSHYLASNHPDFSARLLAQFLDLLFEEDLVREGRPVQLPRDFIERAQTWKTKAPAPAAPPADPFNVPLPVDDHGGEPEPLSARHVIPLEPESSPHDPEAPTEMSEIPADLPLDDGHEEAPTRPLVVPVPLPVPQVPVRAPSEEHPVPDAPWKGPLGLTAGAVVVGFIAVFLGARLTRGTLELTSAPSGAVVRLDGRELPQHTPAHLVDLTGGRTYQVTLELPGYKPWKNDVPLKRGQHLLVNANLEKETPPLVVEPAPGPLPVPVPAPLPPPATPPDELRWPVSRFELDAHRHRLPLGEVGAVEFKLQENVGYRVTLGRGPTQGYAFYVVNPAGAQPGLFPATPLVMKGATRLFVFHASTERDPGRPRPLTVQPVAGGKPLVATVPAHLDVAPAARVRLTGLDPRATYEFTARPGAAAPKLRAEGPTVSRVLVLHPTLGPLFATVGEPLPVTGATELSFTLVDDATDHESGQLVVDARLVRPARHR